MMMRAKVFQLSVPIRTGRSVVLRHSMQTLGSTAEQEAT
jgi:hypothetical protein